MGDVQLCAVVDEGQWAVPASRDRAVDREATIARVAAGARDRHAAREAAAVVGDDGAGVGRAKAHRAGDGAGGRLGLLAAPVPVLGHAAHLLLERHEGVVERGERRCACGRQGQVVAHDGAGADGRAVGRPTPGLEEVQDDRVRARVAAAERHVRAALRGDQIPVVEARVHGATLGGRRNRIGGRDDHERRDALVHERRRPRARRRIPGPPDARIVAGEQRAADPRQRRADQVGLCEERVAALLLGAVVVVVVAAVDAVVHGVRPARIGDRLERLRIHHRVLIREAEERHEVALRGGGERAGQHHAPVGAVELAADRGLEQRGAQLPRDARAVGQREADGDRRGRDPRLEPVVHRPEVATGIGLALRAVVADRERGVEDALELPCRAGPELRPGQRQVDDAVDDHALEPLRVRGGIGLGVLGAVRLAVDADRRAAEPLAECREILDRLARADVGQERRGLQLGDARVDVRDRGGLDRLGVVARGRGRVGARESAAAADAPLVEEHDVVVVEHRLRVARQVAVGAEDAARAGAAGGDDEEPVARLVGGAHRERHLDLPRIGRIEVVEGYGELDAGERAGRRARSAAHCLERGPRARVRRGREQGEQERGGEQESQAASRHGQSLLRPVESGLERGDEGRAAHRLLRRRQRAA